MKKFGRSQTVASGIVSQLIPVVMAQLAKKTNDPNDKSIDLQSITQAISGKGGVGNILGALTNIFGKK